MKDTGKEAARLSQEEDEHGRTAGTYASRDGVTGLRKKERVSTLFGRWRERCKRRGRSERQV